MESKSKCSQTADNPPEQNEAPDQVKARTLIEKVTAINLLEAFAVAVKHYLRGEDGIYYKLVAFGFLARTLTRH